MPRFKSDSKEDRIFMEEWRREDAHPCYPYVTQWEAEREAKENAYAFALDRMLSKKPKKETLVKGNWPEEVDESWLEKYAKEKPQTINKNIGKLLLALAIISLICWPHEIFGIFKSAYHYSQNIPYAEPKKFIDNFTSRDDWGYVYLVERGSPYSQLRPRYLNNVSETWYPENWLLGMRIYKNQKFSKYETISVPDENGHTFLCERLTTFGNPSSKMHCGNETRETYTLEFRDTETGETWYILDFTYDLQRQKVLGMDVRDTTHGN